MHIKVFDKFSLGSLIEKRKKDKAGAEDGQPAEITEIKNGKNGKNGKTKSQVKAPGENPPAPEAVIALAADVIPVRPHGPAAELTLEAEDLQTGDRITLDEVGADKLAQLEEDVKIAEVSAAKAAAAKSAGAKAALVTAAPPQGVPAAATATATAAPAAPAATSKEAKKDEKKDDSDSLNSLFNTEETEENPLASLINALPDVTVRELIDDLAEIQRIIKEWRPNSK